MDWFISGLRHNPELAIFLTLALGFLAGRIRIGTFTLGNVVGTLLAGVVVGQLSIEVNPLVKVVFFDPAPFGWLRPGRRGPADR